MNDPEQAIGSSVTSFQLHKNIATGKYAWFREPMVRQSEWWIASRWFDTLKDAMEWNSVDYLMRRDAHDKRVLQSVWLPS